MTSAVEETRLALQQVAVHVLARRRYAATGRFGLRPSPGGIATPAFGEGPEVVRTCGSFLVVERGADATATELTTLRHAAQAADVDLEDEFSVGADTPAPRDPDAPLRLDAAALDLLAAWYAVGQVALDEAVARTPRITASTVRQIWPEHFDLATAVTLRHDDGGEVHANVGVSPGDSFEPLPYAYVGPWEADRPGDAKFWNAPFGAVLRHADLAPDVPARTQLTDFLRRGLSLL